MKRQVLRRLRRAQPNAAGIVLLLGFLLFSASARATGEAVQTEQLPSAGATGALTGCVNPNTGTSNGDWGIGTDPVYTAVSNTTPVVGEPVYTANTIFWTSRETQPGQSILLAGAFTVALKTVRLAFIPNGTNDWQSLVKASTTTISSTQEGTTGLSFIVPRNFPAGVYGFEIDDFTAPPVLGLANVPSINWAVGVPFAAWLSVALQHQVYDCGAEPGGFLRIFGKNFISSNKVILRTSAGAAYVLTPTAWDTNSITILVPPTVQPGDYSFWVGTAPWSVTSSPAVSITIHSAPSFSVRHVKCFGLVGDGTTDNTRRLQSCLDFYAPTVSNSQLVYIDLPDGTFSLTDGVTLQPFELLNGWSSSRTNFVGNPIGSPPTAWVHLSQYTGLANLSLTAPANPNLLLSSGTTSGDPTTSGHIYLGSVKLTSTTDASNGAEYMTALAGPDIQVYNSSFLSNSNQVFDILFGDGGIVTGNTFILNNWTGLGIEDSQNIIFEHNVTTSQNQPGQGPGGLSAGSGLSVSRGNSQYGPSALSRNIYVGYDNFVNMGSNAQQVVTNDGGGGAYFGPVASSTASTVTLADDPAWNWMGTTNPEASVLAIVYGTGTGQYSFLQSYSGRTINLETPLKVLPDATSVVVISQYELNMTIAHNSFTNTLGTDIVLGDALEGVIEDSTMTNYGFGILISAFGPYGGPAAYGPVMNTDVLRNTLAVGADTFIFPDDSPYLWGIGIQDMPGCAVSGLMIRDNVVPAVNTIYNTDGVNGISANVIEQNQANWAPTFATPGFLIQDNSPPPTQ
jgi:hypothetical protein